MLQSQIAQNFQILVQAYAIQSSLHGVTSDKTQIWANRLVRDFTPSFFYFDLIYANFIYKLS